MMIKNSLISLLKGTPLNKITVKSVCDLAEINRATFYKHYDDVFSVIETIEEELLAELKQLIEHSTQNTIVETFEIIFKKIQTDGDLYKTLFSNNGDRFFPSRVFSICYKNISPTIKKQFPRLSSVQQEWAYNFLAQGSSGILNCWVKNNMEEPPKTVAVFIGQLFSLLMNEFDGK
jgi:AcrR family transcriptional regulator